MYSLKVKKTNFEKKENYFKMLKKILEIFL